MPHLSIVIPVYRSEDCLIELYNRLSKSLDWLTKDYEILFIEDGGGDSSWELIEGIAKQDKSVKGIRLCRNFGQHYALTAGLHHARGDYVVVMDCDLQDNPADIQKLYNKAQEGYEIIYTAKEKRSHNDWLKNFFAKIFCLVFNFLQGSKMADSNVGNFSLITRKVVLAFRQFHDHRRHYVHVLRWLGFRSASVPVEHLPRYAGKSSYTFKKQLLHAIDGITAQSNRLLYLAIGLGFLNVLFAAGMAFYVVMSYLKFGALPGWSSLAFLVLWSTGTLLLALGIVGLYIAKIFEQSKHRPLYLIDQTLNFEEKV